MFIYSIQSDILFIVWLVLKIYVLTIIIEIIKIMFSIYFYQILFFSYRNCIFAENGREPKYYKYSNIIFIYKKKKMCSPI